MYSVIEIQGGIGKNIMATAVVSGIKQKHPDRKVLVITAYPEIFVNNPEVYRVFKFGSCPYFYEDYVRDKDTIFFCAEPYRSNGYLRQDKHLIESWCEAIDVPSLINTKLYLNTRELEAAMAKISVNKPILIFQPFGGAINSKYQYSWNRDIPIEQAQELANILSQTYHVVQPVHNNNRIKLNNCEHINIPLRDLFCMVYFSDKILGIDSCIQHAARALGKSAVVCWITNKPIVFGYNTNVNIFPEETSYLKKSDSLDGYFHEYDFSGSRLYDYPFKDSNIFSVDKIVESVDSI
jgi:hypothetical protein